MLESDNFADNAIRTPIEFRRRFRMNKELFMNIFIGVRKYDDYFLYNAPDCQGSPMFHKYTAALRCLVYGAPPDMANDYLRMAESTAQVTMWEFTNACVIMQNMIMESEDTNLVHDELPYDWEGPLAQVDHQALPEFEIFSTTS
jgi:hypothetical protein